MPGLSHWLQRLKRLPRWVWGIGLLALMGLASIPFGTDVQAPETPALSGGDALSAAGMALSVFWKLGLVLLLIYASLYLLRRWQGGKLGGSTRKMSILETTRLSPRQAIHLVKVGQQVFLIGATDSNVTLVSEVDALPQVEKQPAMAESQPATLLPASNFGNVLSSLLVKR